MGLQFSWTDLWAYYEAIEDPKLKDHLEEEVIGQGWLYRQSAKEQKKVLTGAPESFVKRVAKNLRPEVQIDLGFNPYL